MKVFTKTIFLLLLLNVILHFYNFANAQDAELMHKYVDYRNRLLNEWVIISPDVEQFGVNIPAVDRRLDTAGNPKWVSWSDGNCNFNHWLGILSTEYRLLKNNGEDYHETLEMLVYALFAIERLDLYSEYTLRKHHNTEGNITNDIQLVHFPDDINGFLIRDDVTLGFWRQYHNHFKSEYGWHNKTKDGSNRYLSVFQRGVIPKQGMSQDNIIYMLQSLALVKQLVDNEPIASIKLNFINNYIPLYLSDKKIIYNDSIFFGKWVEDITDRLICRMQHEYPEQRIVMKAHKGTARPNRSNMGGVLSSAWYIMNPITNDLVAEGNGEDMGVWMNSYGVAEAGNFIAEEDKYHTDGSEKGLNAYIFKTLLFKNFRFLRFGGFPVPEPLDDYMFRALASVADINWNKNSYDLLYLLGDKRERWTYEHNPLVLVLLHSEKYNQIYRPDNEFYENDKKYYQEILGFAPESFPSTDDTRPDYHPYWSSSSRLNWPNNTGRRSPNDVWDFAGMDYLFLHNLYRLVFSPTEYDLPKTKKSQVKDMDYNKYPEPNMKDIDAQFFHKPPSSN
ncbi:MAG: hypothetical protein PHP52_01875 [Bacteroidales bacterium]|nr:hypothetical protein [Bacteroidales bacterium]MDD4216419.1 hypothetical protein [Bacteroidales bacterium]